MSEGEWATDTGSKRQGYRKRNGTLTLIKREKARSPNSNAPAKGKVNVSHRYTAAASRERYGHFNENVGIKHSGQHPGLETAVVEFLSAQAGSLVTGASRRGPGWCPLPPDGAG